MVRVPGLSFWEKLEKVGLARLIVYSTNLIISGTCTNFTRAQTTFSVGASTGEILVQHG